jgi:uncharacterized protein (TIGR03000 family)
MYSAVLMLALTAGSETADFGRNRCHGGGASCAGTVVRTCSATTTASCASSCSARHGLFGNRGHGCSTSCSSGRVAYAGTSCSRSHGCASRCSGGGLFNRGHGCHGGYGCSSGSYGCSSSYGCACTGGVIIDKKAMPKSSEPVPAPKTKKVQNAAPATILVSLPADARLIVDGAPTTSTSERRTLITPELEFGATYVYTMRAEVIRDGDTQTQTQQVIVRGGETASVEFNFSTPSVASR